MRHCDNCTACIKIFGFIEKPVEFQCEWLKGNFRKEDRPDKSGLIFTIESNRIAGERHSLVARESQSGAFAQSRDLLVGLARRRLLVLQKQSSCSYLGPEETLERVRRLENRARKQ